MAGLHSWTSISFSLTANHGLRMQKDHVEPLRGVHAFPCSDLPPGLAPFLALSIEDDKPRFDPGAYSFFISGNCAACGSLTNISSPPPPQLKLLLLIMVLSRAPTGLCTGTVPCWHMNPIVAKFTRNLPHTLSMHLTARSRSILGH
jgi:hypothetical protein